MELIFLSRNGSQPLQASPGRLSVETPCHSAVHAWMRSPSRTEFTLPSQTCAHLVLWSKDQPAFSLKRASCVLSAPSPGSRRATSQNTGHHPHRQRSLHLQVAVFALNFIDTSFICYYNCMTSSCVILAIMSIKKKLLLRKLKRTI